MRDLPRIYQKLIGEPWLVTPAWHRNAAAIFHKLEPTGLTISERQSERMQPGAEFVAPGLAVIPVSGPIGKHLSAFEMDCGGGFCLTRFNYAIDKAVADGAQAIVFDMDSPGGTVTGVAETGAKIAGLKDRGIMTVAYTESMCCSACYWLACGCDTVIAAPSAYIGSVGVYCAMLDTTAYWEAEGVKWEYFIGQHASMKAMGAEGRSLTDEQRQRLQASVDKLATEFHAWVGGRRNIGADAMDQIKTGDAWRAADAPAGIVDGFAPTIEAVWQKLLK